MEGTRTGVFQYSTAEDSASYEGKNTNSPPFCTIRAKFTDDRLSDECYK